MKKITPALVKTFDKVIVLFLGFLGLATRCMPVAEYGTPHADYHFRGDITNKGNKEPIENIQVKVYQDDTLLIGQSVTDSAGAYAMDIDLFPLNYQFRITAEDTDGAESGLFASKDTVVSAEISDLSGGDGWYEGEMEIRTDISLEEDLQ